MAPQSAASPVPPHRIRDQREVNEYFAPQPTPRAELPAPEPLLRNLAIGVLDVLAGVRDAEQLARWLSEDAFLRLVTRANLSTRARSARGAPVTRPVFTIASVHCAAAGETAVEGVVIISAPARTRALAVRLEGVDGRWRATSLALL